jgi:hypothetical protein
LETLARFEETGFSIWMRESGVAFFGTLTVHALAMALVIGINIALSLRLLGFAPKLAIAPSPLFPDPLGQRRLVPLVLII